VRIRHVICLAIWTAAAPGIASASNSKPISSQPDLAAAISQLQQPETRFEAFLSLEEFAGKRTMGNIVALNGLADATNQFDQMRRQAAEAADHCPGLEGLIAAITNKLSDQGRRLEMISSLLNFSSDYFQQVGSVIFVLPDPALNDLKGRVREAANHAADVPTVSQALTNSDPALQKWAVQQFGNSLQPASDWLPLLPRIEAMASGEDRELRGAATKPLAHFPNAREFLHERFSVEKYPFCLMNMLHDQEIWGNDFDRKFVPRLSTLLDDPDETVRVDALDFIGCNKGWAGMFQVSFGQNIFDKVITLARSRSANERYMALFALDYVGETNPEASRQALFRLATDVDENVRWRVGFCLADQQDRADVKKTLDALLHDKSPRVRLETVFALGWEKHPAELRELAKCPDADVAKSATDTLKRFEDQHKPGPNDRF
jgi:HEAT repeat protein